jgi:hypothetical protein
MVSGNMVGGFALVAYPTQYRNQARGITLPTSICCTTCLQLALFDRSTSYH